MKLFSIGLTVYATAYIRAENAEEARDKARQLRNLSIEVPPGKRGDVMISGLPFDHPDLPDLSVSPAMTTGEEEPEAPEDITDHA